MNRADLIASATLVPQTYGIACAQTVYGGPRGIWLECKGCNRSEKIAGSRYADEPIGSLTDAEAAEVFRRHGWTGEGDKMLDQRCPTCSTTGCRMTRAARANPPPLHRAIGTSTICGLKLGSHFDRHWRHPRLPEHARPFWHDGVRVIWATPICEDITCAKCAATPK